MEDCSISSHSISFKTILQKMKERGFTPAEIAFIAETLIANENGSQEALLAQRAKNRERQRRFRAAKKSNVTVTLPNVTSKKDEQNQQPRNVTVTLPIKEGIYVEDKDVKPMYVEVTEVKEESTNVEVKEVPLKQVTVEQVTVSRARARKKSGTEIPEIWPTPELIKIGIGFGFSEEQAQSELAAMQDWALSKDERKVNWIAFARNWFRTAKKKLQFSANGHASIQKISPRLQVILNNERLFHEAARQQSTDDNCFETPELRSLGEPTSEIIPKNRNSGYG